MCGKYGDNDFRDQMDAEITRVFNRFAGKTVDPSNPKDPVLKEMQDAATDYFGRIRLVPRGARREDDNPLHITRINAELVPDGNTWKIGNRFFRG